MIRFSETTDYTGSYARGAVDELVRAVLAALPHRVVGPGGSGVAFEHTTGDEFCGYAGPGDIAEDREEFEEYRYGAPGTELTVRFSRTYYLMSQGRRDWRSRSARIAARGWGAGVEFAISIDLSYSLYWILPRNEHEAMLAAWRAFATAHGLTVGWAREPVSV